MSHGSPIIAPSPFVMEWLARLDRSNGRRIAEPRRALDVAMGRGRHAVVLTRAGFRTFGVDIRLDAIRDATTAAAREGRTIAAWCADLTVHPLPRAFFQVIVVTRYLQRDLFPALCDAVAPGGIAIYETFTTAQRMLASGPTSPHHLLAPGELRAQFSRFDVLFYEEVSAPEAVARLVAIRPL